MTSDEGRKPEGAPERSPKAGVGAPSGVDGNGPKRFSVQRKMAIVARLLRGEPLDLVARQTNVSIARLTEWRDRALAGAATALKERERDDRDDEIARLKSKVGEITMDNELLNPPNRRGTDPYARWCGRGGIARCPPIPIDRSARPSNAGVRAADDSFAMMR